MGRDCSCHDACARHDDARTSRPSRTSSDPALDLATARVTVTRGASSAIVDLAILAQRRVGAERRVCLADVWAASRLPGDLTDLAFDFVGEDGFRSSARQPPASGVLLTRGFVDARSRDLAWDDALAMPCAFRVKRVTLIVAHDAIAHQSQSRSPM
jgi:hypothetical protein